MPTDTRMTSDSSLAVGTTAVYWTLPEQGKIMTVPIEGGTPKVFAQGERTFDVAVDAKNVYWSDDYTNKIMKTPIEGGTYSLMKLSPK